MQSVADLIAGIKPVQIKSPDELEQEAMQAEMNRDKIDQFRQGQLMRKELQGVSDPQQIAGILAKYDPIKGMEFKSQLDQQQNEKLKTKRQNYLDGINYVGKQAAILSNLYDDAIKQNLSPQDAEQRIIPLFQRAASRAKELYPDLDITPEWRGIDELKMEASQYDEFMKNYNESKKPQMQIAPNGQVIDIKDPQNLNKNFSAPKELKAPPTRDRFDGQTVIQEELQPDGTWKQIGKGARFKQTPDTVVNVGDKETFKNERDLRNDFNSQPTSKAFREVQTAYDQITTALKNPSAANDLAAATKFMKLLDPGSVVRESELGMAMEATGKLDQYTNLFNRLKTGQKLTPAQRIDFAKSAEALYEAASSRYNESADEFRGYASNYNLNPDMVAKKAKSVNKEKAPPADQLKKGDVVMGNVYLGGDPSKPSSWKAK